MNILIVPPNDLINNVLPNRLYHLARNWERHHVIYLLRYPHYPTSIDVERPLRRIDITPKARSSGNPGTYYIKNATTLYESLKSVIEHEPVDVIIHANILPSLFTIRLAKKFRIKTIFDYLDHYPESASAYFRNSQIKWIVHTIVSFITSYNIKNSDEIVTVSYTLKKMLERRTKRQVYLIPNGVDTQLFRPLLKDHARQELALESYDPILLYYGSIAEWIDYKVLLKLVAKLKSRYPNILLLLVGKIYKKSEEKELSEFANRLSIERNVEVISSQPQEKIPTYVASADIVYAPYRDVQKNYGTPVKILETLACERPVIATELEEFKRWFKNFLFYYNNMDELKRLTLLLLNKYEDYKHLMIEARNYVVKNFEWKVLAENYEKLLHGEKNLTWSEA